MNIGDIFLRVLADVEGFQADVVDKAGKAGDAAGLTLGQRMGAAVKANGAKLIGGALALAGGIAIKGLQELRSIEAEFRAETGATADEATRAGKAILAMSGRNIAPMEEIGKTLTRVYTDLHLTGDAAAAATQQFLTFGRATGQNAVDAVGLFADILHAWNLTADHSGEIMDALVVSHQRYGTAVADNEAALAALAPALIAANQTWADGLALLNLFRESGIDSAVAVTSMTKALAKVTSPEELKQLIADIIATEDPFLRASKAADLFGAKAGPKLANVLRPGISGLDDYAISQTDAAGATEEAAAVLDNTLGARFQLLLKQAGAAIVGLGNDWGGLATVVATVGSVMGTLGGRKIASALGGGLKAVWTKAAGSSVVTKAVAFAGGKAATVYLATLIAGDAIGGALSKAWLATGGRLLAAAGLTGAAAGRAFAIGAGAAIAAAPLAVLTVAIQIQSDIDKQGDALKQQATAFAKTASDDALAKAIDGVQKQLDGMVFNTFDSKNKVIAVLNELIAESNRRAGQITTSLAPIPVATQKMAIDGGRGFSSLSSAATTTAMAIARNASSIATNIKNLTATLLGEAIAMINGYYDPIIAHEELRVAKDTVAADTVARNATKAGTAARHEADLTLANSQKNLDTTRANLLASGALSAREQKAWLTELQKKYKTATGDAKAKIGELIAKIRELQHVSANPVQVRVAVQPGGLKQRAGGGPVKAGQPYLVNENTPDSEIWVPEVSGRVLGPSATPVSASGQSTTWAPEITIHNPVPHAAEEDIGLELRRLAALGY